MSETKEDYKDCKVEEDNGQATKILVTHFADDAKEQPEEEVSFFTQSCLMRSALTDSIVDPEAPIKKRVGFLETAVENQKERDDVTFANIEALSKDTERIEKALNDAVNAKTASMEEALQRFKMEVHHRFELQGAENKRLQASVAALKAENHALTKTLMSMDENLMLCVKEMGIEEEELSRPNTAM